MFRTADGGKTWQRTLFVDAEHRLLRRRDRSAQPARALCRHVAARDPHLGTHQRRPGQRPVPSDRRRRHLEAARPGTACRSRRSARSRRRSRRATPNRVYALIETGDGMPADHGEKTQSGSLWRSDDGGDTWKLVSSDRRLRGRTHYYTRFAIEPDNENERYFLSAEFIEDASTAARPPSISPASSPRRGDDHDMWIDPTNGDRMAVAHDDGLSFSVNRGRSWHQIQLPVAQMYHVAADNQVPLQRLRQPAGRAVDARAEQQPARQAVRGRGAGPIPRGLWHSVAGGESGWADSRSHRRQHHLVDRHRLRQPRRHRRALRRADTPGARSRDLARGDHRRGRRRY